MYPQSADGKIIRRSLVNSNEVIVMETTQIQNRETNSNWQNQKVLQEEQLIEEIRKRPALWNFKLPLSERGLQAKKKLWEEIFTAMNGTMDIAIMKKKWKSLCDSYRIHKNKQHQPSGSAGTRKSSWVHFEQMQFLRDVQSETETTTNIPATEGHEESNDSINSDSICFDGGSSSSGRGSRPVGNNKRRLSVDDESMFDRFIDALGQPPVINIPPFTPSLPTSPTDEAQLFGNLIATQLREMDPDIMDDTMVQVMQLINSAKRRKRK
ncbi:PREDICTED: uncharacterized protein LOC105568899 [Vollenhovia emeryi]|uniref:uncharacterized protein LOC105568899 n=1 Tax=Vollenhovia emeryi TaxID=411798 RepID=UPI0005F36143|nr:PREDICTED: uncharacterized protein LOC105568899 [Vollenhovia emeryi]